MKKTTLAKASTGISSEKFMEKVQEQYVNKYASDVVQMIEDKNKLQKALDRVSESLQKVERGEYEGIEEYKKARRKLELEDGFEF